MAPTAAALPVLLLLLLLLPDAARGNEGGAAGSCQCRRVGSRPRFLDKLESCDACLGFTRFSFPNRRVCGLDTEAWVIELKSSHCGKGRPGEGAERADASRGYRLPAPTSQSTVPAPTSPSSAGINPDKSREMPWAAESHTDAAKSHTNTARVPTTAGSGPEPSAKAAAREADDEAPSEREAAPPPALDTKTPSITVLLSGVCVALAAVAAALVYIWRRRAGRGPQAPLGDGGEQEKEGETTLPLAPDPR